VADRTGICRDIAAGEGREGVYKEDAPVSRQARSDIARVFPALSPTSGSRGVSPCVPPCC